MSTLALTELLGMPVTEGANSRRRSRTRTRINSRKLQLR